VILDGLENTLPNGLHEGEIRRITVDYQQRQAVFDLEIWVGNVAGD
jgi:hypothetical protein